VGNDAEQILERSQDGYDVILLCTHVRTGPARWLLGSVAESVVSSARMPTLLMPAPKPDHKPAPEKEPDRPEAIAHEEASRQS
jgi:hypothetical protein